MGAERLRHRHLGGLRPHRGSRRWVLWTSRTKPSLPLDLWLFLAVYLTYRAIGSDDYGDRRAWLAKLFSYQVLIWIPFGFYTALELLDGPPELALLMVGGGGVAAFAYGNTKGLRPVIGAAALAFISAVWYWGVERGGALGAVFALALTAALLFWISGRSGDPDE